ncbi:MAG: integral rane sensor signal transduction histidine kinase [Solirubrobacterales bacterium]|nr:integral rane sensor signal transduction histidine kinase [Solirubrobacterales bacterium]
MRRRLAAAIIGVSAGALLLFGLPLAFAVTRVYRDEELIRVQRLATSATQAIGPAIGRSDPAELPQDGVARMALYDRAGRRVGGHGPIRADGPVRQALHGRVGQSTAAGRLVVAVPVARSERVIGVIRADRGNGVVHARARAAWLVMAGIAAAVLALATGIAVLVARRITRPVETLTTAVRRLGDGDFTVRTTPSGVPELDDAAAALDTTARRLGDLVDRERAFSADASHQLRTPLTALRLDLEAGDSARALTQVDRLQDTVTTLLAAARDGTPAPGRVSLPPLLAELRTAWSGRLAAAGRPLRVVAGEPLPPAAAAAGAIRQILQVLVENAVVHGAGPVVVSVRQTGGAIAIDVSDEGPGVTGDVEAIFERRSASEHGSGIGLALARSLATADGGRLVLQRRGPSPTFTLLLAIAGDA